MTTTKTVAGAVGYLVREIVEGDVRIVALCEDGPGWTPAIERARKIAACSADMGHNANIRAVRGEALKAARVATERAEWIDEVIGERRAAGEFDGDDKAELNAWREMATIGG